jgi:hypothetical protein
MQVRVTASGHPLLVECEGSDAAKLAEHRIPVGGEDASAVVSTCMPTSSPSSLCVVAYLLGDGMGLPGYGYEWMSFTSPASS